MGRIILSTEKNLFVFRFLDRVRHRLEGRPQDYSDFLNIMKVIRGMRSKFGKLAPDYLLYLT